VAIKCSITYHIVDVSIKFIYCEASHTEMCVYKNSKQWQISSSIERETRLLMALVSILLYGAEPWPISALYCSTGLSHGQSVLRIPGAIE